MKFSSRPGFYLILLLIGTMLLLTAWLFWKLDTLPRRNAGQDPVPQAVSIRP